MTVENFKTGLLRIIRQIRALVIAWAICGVGQIASGWQAQTQVTIAEQTDIASLIELSADRLGLRIEYDAKAMKSQDVTLRLETALTADELWALVHQLLASRGFAAVQTPGGQVLTVVPIAQAGERARLELDAAEFETQASFVSVVKRVEHRPAKDVTEAIKLVLSKPGGSVGPLGEQGLLLISDLKPRIEQALWVLSMVDKPGADPVVQRIDVVNASAANVAASATAAIEARNAMVSLPLQGKLRPMLESNSLLLIAPAIEVDRWTDLIRGLDQREPVERRTYTPPAFALSDVAKLLEESARDSGMRGSGDRWKLVADALTGSLIITATPSEHDAIELVLQRLASLPPEARRPLRAFAVRNRQVSEIAAIVEQLIAAGVLETTPEAPPETEGGDGSALSETMSVGGVGTPQPTPGLQTTIRQAVPTRDLAGGSRRGAVGRDTASTRALTLTADEATNTIIAVGEARLLGQLEELIQRLDVRQAQVLLEVLVISLNDGDTLDLGVELEKLEISGSTLISLSSLFGLGGPIASAGTLPPGAGGGAGGTGVVLSPGDFSVIIRALQTINDGRALSMPKVLVSNNQQATLDSVLQQPFASTNASDTVATTSFGGTQDAGTTVSIKPQIAEGDHLLLEYSVALSSFVGESSDPTLPPPRQQNSLSSIVSIPDGFTVVVGGLELVNDAEAISQVPLLGSIPIIGEAFKNRSQSQSRSRFFVFIRANVLRHDRFEDLKYLSARDLAAVHIVADDFPEVQPRIIK